jgi:hypothetical protein
MLRLSIIGVAIILASTSCGNKTPTNPTSATIPVLLQLTAGPNPVSNSVQSVLLNGQPIQLDGAGQYQGNVVPGVYELQGSFAGAGLGVKVASTAGNVVPGSIHSNAGPLLGVTPCGAGYGNVAAPAQSQIFDVVFTLSDSVQAACSTVQSQAQQFVVVPTALGIGTTIAVFLADSMFAPTVQATQDVSFVPGTYDVFGVFIGQGISQHGVNVTFQGKGSQQDCKLGGITSLSGPGAQISSCTAIYLTTTPTVQQAFHFQFTVTGTPALAR